MWHVMKERTRPGLLRWLVAGLLAVQPAWASGTGPQSSVDEQVAALLARMTLAEKIGQMQQVDASAPAISDQLRQGLAAGKIGSVINSTELAKTNELQRIAVEESRLGIPLLVARDVIHGFNTVLPIPLGQAASWNSDLVRRGARMAALEARTHGVNWTFAPMIDVTRDPRWGRIAESFGEDPYLTGLLGVAMIEGFQGDDLSLPGTIAACAKHFVGYGASESGRDYNTTNIPENELRNVYLPPFKDAVDAGVATIMTSFSDLDGVPASANRFLLQDVLRDEWGFDGFVVSDWASIDQLTAHGLTADARGAAYEAASAGVNMEMASTAYADHLHDLVTEGHVSEQRIDQLVTEMLRVRVALGLFQMPYTDASHFPATGNPAHLDIARQAALQSLVLLENRDATLPLDHGALGTVAVIGPLADDPYEQMGTWVFDGDQGLSQTPLQAIREMAGDSTRVVYERAMETSRSRSTERFAAARAAAEAADAVLVFLGEEAILSGEAHSRADIGLPGNQAELVHLLAETGKPIIAVILAGRPLTLANILDQVDALLYAWHPGSMGGPAIADVLFGLESPSGKLPVTFPRMVGQVPIYYAHKNTGKPGVVETFVHIDDIPVRLPQTSSGFTSNHLDAGLTPQYPFGYGLSYARFTYSDIALERREVPISESVVIRAQVRNEGDVAADEIVQLYLRDLAGSVTRPVRELKGFERVRLLPGESRIIRFELDASDLAFYGRDMKLNAEAGEFHAWIGGSSTADLQTGFTITGASAPQGERP